MAMVTWLWRALFAELTSHQASLPSFPLKG